MNAEDDLPPPPQKKIYIKLALLKRALRRDKVVSHIFITTDHVFKGIPLPFIIERANYKQRSKEAKDNDDERNLNIWSGPSFIKLVISILIIKLQICCELLKS